MITSFLLMFRQKMKLPPGPSLLFSQLLVLTHPLPQLQSLIKYLNSKYGPILTLFIGTHPFVLAASLPPHTALHGVYSVTISSPLSCTLQTSNPTPASARKWTLCIMINHLREQQETLGTVNVVDHIELAMLRLSSLMCFGKKLEDRCINDIARIQDGLLLLAGSLIFNAILVSRSLAKTLFRNKWKKFDQLRKDQKELLVSLIKSRTEASRSETKSEEEQLVTYVDTLVKLHVPEEPATNRKAGKLTQKEIVSLCGEFLVVGTETTSSALQWIMANLVKHPRIQHKLYDEIVAVVGPPPPLGVELESVINEESLQKMKYLKAVVLEGLRRHPPGHMLLPHRVNEEVEVQGYMIPKGATINFMVAEMGWDPEVWDDPMEFKPERFLTSNINDGVFDIGGSKEMKMMPFGAGRRICPGADLALLHLEYFVANLIWYFEWSVPDGCHVDLTEKVKFTVIMNNPLQAIISSRTKTTNI
ncbi:hypothetical protein QVD17_04896 [Tagetes erecta]|uniref:Cytochrome P450 n=1 Tax=Tagetes erecta TaxID=13708 RepID=A0AAD8PB10_TARER|nr:hypothetical protein QVD17_04896 [Tagetes erecta]